MKTKYSSNSALAHNFATVSFNEPQFTTGNSMFTDDNIIYSYGRHFPIARKTGERVALFTLSRYGNATVKHISDVRRAMSHYRLIHCYVINIGDPDNVMHTANVAHFLEMIGMYADQAQRARALRTYNRAVHLYRQEEDYLTRYCEYFGLHLPSVPESEDSDERRSLLAEKELTRAARADRSEAEKLERWLACKSNKLPQLPYNAPVLIRYNAKNARFETSKSVQIPLEAARRFAAAYRAGAVQPGDHILSYTVDTVGADYLKIGCHTIETKLINELIEKHKLA